MSFALIHCVENMSDSEKDTRRKMCDLIDNYVALDESLHQYWYALVRNSDDIPENKTDESAKAFWQQCEKYVHINYPEIADMKLHKSFYKRVVLLGGEYRKILSTLLKKEDSNRNWIFDNRIIKYVEECAKVGWTSTDGIISNAPVFNSLEVK